MKAVRFHAHGGRGGAALRGRTRRPRHGRATPSCACAPRAQSPRHLAAPRHRARAHSLPAHLRRRRRRRGGRGARRRRSRAGRRVMLQPGLSCGRCAAVPRRPRQRVPALRRAGLPERRRLRRVRARAGAEPDPDSRHDRLRRGRGVSADVPHRVAHAAHARAAAGRRRRARAGRRQRRGPGRHPDRAAARRAGVRHGRDGREAGAGARSSAPTKR